jgi:hypothetical protein
MGTQFDTGSVIEAHVYYHVTTNCREREQHHAYESVAMVHAIHPCKAEYSRANIFRFLLKYHVPESVEEYRGDISGRRSFKVCQLLTCDPNHLLGCYRH